MEGFKRVLSASTIQKILDGQKDHFMGAYAVVPEHSKKDVDWNSNQISPMEIFREAWGNGISVFHVKGMISDSDPPFYKETMIFLCAYHSEKRILSCIHDDFFDPEIPNEYRMGEKQKDLKRNLLADIFSYLVPVFFTMNGQLDMEEFKESGATPLSPAFPVFYRGLCEAILYIVQHQDYGLFDFLGDPEKIFYYMHQFGSDPEFYSNEFSEDQIISYAFCCDQKKLIAQTACDFAKKSNAFLPALLSYMAEVFLKGKAVWKKAETTEKERYQEILDSLDQSEKTSVIVAQLADGTSILYPTASMFLERLSLQDIGILFPQDPQKVSIPFSEVKSISQGKKIIYRRRNAKTPTP